MNGTNIIGGGLVGNPGTGWNVLDNNMRFIYSTSANETLAATPASPDEFVFTSFAAGSHTISGFNPVQDMIEFSKAQFASVHRRAGSDLGGLRRGDDQPGQWQFVVAARGRCGIAARQQLCVGLTNMISHMAR